MSGLNEIIQWVKDNTDLASFDNVDDAYEELNNTEDWRNDLDDILLDQKPKFLEFLETQIGEPSIFEFQDRIQISAYSYIRNGETINVPAHSRRKPKR